MYRALIIFSFGLAAVFASQAAMAAPKSTDYSSDQQEQVLVIPSYDSDEASVILASHRRYYHPRPYRYYYYRPPYRYDGRYYRRYPHWHYGPYYGPYHGYRYYYYGPGVYYYGPHVQFRIGF